MLWGTALTTWRAEPVTPERSGLEVTRINHNLGKIHDVEVASFELSYWTPTARPAAQRTARHPRRRVPQGVGWARRDGQVPAGLPGIQKEGCDGLITSAVWCCITPAHTHRLPGVLRPCSDAVLSIVEIKDYLFAEAARSGVVLAGLEHLDDRCKAVGYAN